jgi:dihydrofolate reductase
MISLIVAAARNRAIGQGGRLPWHLPDDLRHFRAKTLGKTVLMGRRTYESLGKPLPGRKNVVVTRDATLQAPGCTVVFTLENALACARAAEEIMVIGGASLYADLLPHAERIYLTSVHADIEGDAFFPELDPHEWVEASREHHAADERHAYAFTFIELFRKLGEAA